MKGYVHLDLYGVCVVYLRSFDLIIDLHQGVKDWLIFGNFPPEVHFFETRTGPIRFRPVPI